MGDLNCGRDVGRCDDAMRHGAGRRGWVGSGEDRAFLVACLLLCFLLPRWTVCARAAKGGGSRQRPKCRRARTCGPVRVYRPCIPPHTWAVLEPAAWPIGRGATSGGGVLDWRCGDLADRPRLPSWYEPWLDGNRSPKARTRIEAAQAQAVDAGRSLWCWGYPPACNGPCRRPQEGELRVGFKNAPREGLLQNLDKTTPRTQNFEMHSALGHTLEPALPPPFSKPWLVSSIGGSRHCSTDRGSTTARGRWACWCDWIA